MYKGFRRNRNAKWFAIESQNNIFGPGDVFHNTKDERVFYIRSDGSYVEIDGITLENLGIGQVGMMQEDDE